MLMVKYLLLFFGTLLFFNSSAQVWRKDLTGNDPKSNYAAITYTIANGLPSRNTTTVLKDRDGFMWVGTENGLCKFDGYTFKTFTNRKGDTTSLSNNFINALIQDKKGRVWVGTMDGLNLFDPITERFSRFNHSEHIKYSLSNDKIWSLLEDTKGSIWVGTDDGFNLFKEINRSFQTFRPDSGNRFSIKGKSVNAIIQIGNALWLGNWGDGLNKFDLNTGKFYNYKLPYLPGEKNPNDLWSLCKDENGMIWVGSYWKGLFQFNPTNNEFKTIKGPAGGNQSVFTLLDMGNHTLLVGGNEKFWWVNTLSGSWQSIDNVPNNPHGHAFRDGNDLIWISSQNGLTKIDYKQNKFDYYPVRQTRWEITGILVRDSTIWVGTNKGLAKYDFKDDKVIWFKHSPDKRSLGSDQIRNIYQDNAGKIWLATEFGFDEFDERTGTFMHHYHHSFLGKLYNEDVFRDILEIQNGIYGLATDAGFKIYNSHTGKFTHYYSTGLPGSISNNHLTCLLRDEKNNIWIGTTGGGLNRFNPATGKFRVYLNDEHSKGSISDNTIQNIFEDTDHNIWICTADGLNKYVGKTDSFITYSKADGFGSGIFNQIVQDASGNLWTTTETGVSMFNPRTRYVRNFDEADGVFDNTALCKDKAGNIYLAGNNGFEYFNPLHIIRNTGVPPVFFSELQIFNKTVQPSSDGPLNQNLNVAKKLVLNYDQSVFSVDFVALNYTRPEKNEYAYFLEGFDKKWIFPGNQHKATYTNLDPGTYHLHVKAANNDGVWNKTGKTLTIIITPPWYRTIWADALYVLLLAMLIWAYVRYRDHQAKLRYEIKLAHLQGEKEKEINERKLSFFTNISHEFRTPLTLIINPIKDMLYKESEADVSSLGIVYRNAKRLLSLVDQLLLFRKAESGAEKLKITKLNIGDLCREVFLCFTHQAQTKHIQFEFKTENDHLDLYGDREKLEIILFNLIGNAIKFTPEYGKIGLFITDEAEHVGIRISDTGCGIPAGTGDKLYSRFYQEKLGNNSSGSGFGIGLYLVKNFVDSHKGEITYESSTGEGTTFTLSFLKGSEHFRGQDIAGDPGESSHILKELIEDEIIVNLAAEEADSLMADPEVNSEQQSILVIDDNDELREYLRQIFKIGYRVYDASNGSEGLEKIREVLPDIVISDVMMDGMTGIELCAKVREDIAISHIPVILLTSSSSAEIKLKGLEGGADDYISKPFDKDILKARVAGILKSKNTLQKYFYNEITLNKNPHKISIEYKTFLENCIRVVEDHLQNPDFTIQVLAAELGISHSTLYKKIKFISGQSANSFIRFIRLRRAAYLFIHTNNNVFETSYYVGINDIKYFREQFKKVFDLNPSQYIKKYRKIFSNDMVNHERH